MQPLTLAQASEALSHIPADDRETWLLMAMAIKSEFGEEGFDTWNDWSSSAESYREKDARDVWKSVHPVGRRGSVTIATLIKEAKRSGWAQADEKLSDAELKERKRRAAERRKEAKEKGLRAEKALEAAREVVAEAAQRIIEEMTVDSGKSAYLDQKKVRAFGVRFVRRPFLVVCHGDPDEGETLSVEFITGRDRIAEFLATPEEERPSFKFIKPGAVLIPARDIEGRIRNTQIIWPATGHKTFLKYGRKQGTFHLIGEPEPEGVLAIGEGYATVASGHMAMGWPGAIAWDAGNLEVVGPLLHGRYPDADIVILGDDDHENPKNPGREKARRAAGLAGGIPRFPRFTDPAGRSDWNDLHVAEGIDAVRTQLEAPPANDELPLKGTRTKPARPNWVWHKQFARNREGGIKISLHNLALILENHPAWRGVFALDGFANQIHRVKSTPYSETPGLVEDTDGSELATWLGNPANYGLSAPTRTVLEAVEMVAARRRFHPVTDYLDGLTWDGTERLPYVLSDFFGAAGNDYTAAVGVNWSISAVARVRNPGRKVDTMVILEGPQGLRKSTAINLLCGDDWFAEVLDSPQNKDFFQVIASGLWIVEISELQAFNKADRFRIKMILSARSDTYRPSYGHFPRKFPRQCIFVGSTNESIYLKDETGARRFFPVRCGEIDIEALRDNRDQLWAEADARFRRGNKWWEFPDSAIKEQDERFDEDPLTQPIAKWLNQENPAERYPERLYPIESGNPVKNAPSMR